MIVVQKFICNLGEDEEKGRVRQGGMMASVRSSTRPGRNFFPQRLEYLFLHSAGGGQGRRV
jgi:hypothetical protein